MSKDWRAASARGAGGRTEKKSEGAPYNPLLMTERKVEAAPSSQKPTPFHREVIKATSDNVFATNQ